MRRLDDSPRPRRPSCVWPAAADAAEDSGSYAGTRLAPAAGATGPTDWAIITEDRLLDFADELSEDALAHLSLIAGEYGFIAVVTDIVDRSGAVNGRLVLAEPRVWHDDDTLGLIVIPPGGQPGDGILFTRPRT